MAGTNYLPAKDAALLAWSTNFSGLITATPTVFGLTAPQATAYAALNTAYATALAAVDPGIRNKATVATKNAARASLKASARMLARIIEANPTITNAQKLTLGLTVRAVPTPIPAPSTAPMLDIISVIGRSVKVRLHGALGDRRGKPAGVALAFVYSFVGTTPPTDLTMFKFEGSSTRTTFDILFPTTVAGGSQVWLYACWANPRTQSGPACAPVTAYLQGAAAHAA
jgi:hypothetical protein